MGWGDELMFQPIQSGNLPKVGLFFAPQKVQRTFGKVLRIYYIKKIGRFQYAFNS